MLQRKSAGPERMAAVRWGTISGEGSWKTGIPPHGETYMNGIIYLIGLVVVVLAVLSFFGLG
ncbi:hypothetical protein [Mesorhizobium australicum]|uniref:Uncharacterized protein n=1 Tax=Mesorhizobium australicum TaxID=536018 RepID=A0A1X7NTZ2_9HYPH|nr:hypothetical protein [Mesorhizobium australicum]SMH41080.1 hypothetical protein SAMN02982922_2476 [Mesorhizobium australicum]